MTALLRGGARLTPSDLGDAGASASGWAAFSAPGVGEEAAEEVAPSEVMAAGPKEA